MPWLSEAMKDVISCDKLRVGETFSEKNSLENETIDGDSPVFEAERSVVVS